MRMTLTRTAGALAVAALATAGCSAGAADAPRDGAASKGAGGTALPALPARFAQQQPHWTPCGPDVVKDALPGAECTWIEVPVDYAAPAKESIELRVSRVKAEDRAGRLGSLLHNPGGPGAGAAADVASGAWKPGDKASARYDLVGFDPRGIGDSAPVGCPTGKNAPQGADLTRMPRTEAEADKAFAEAGARAKACQKASGPVFAHMDTASVARDLDIIRTVLGDAKLTYVGTSYGTYIGQKYAQLFPDRVGRLVLDGVVDPGRDMRQVTDLDVTVTQAEFQRYAEECAAGGRCPLGATGDEVVSRVTAFVQSLDGKPLPGPDGEELTTTVATDAVTKLLPRKEDWPLLTRALAAGLAGNATPLMSLTKDNGTPDGGDPGDTAGRGRAVGGVAPRADADFNSDIAQMAVLCLDSKAPRTARELLDAAETLAGKSPLFGRTNAWSMVDCAAWPVPPAGGPERITAAGAPPVLLVSYTHDVATPLDNARAVQADLGNASLIIREGTGHGAYMSGSACTDRFVDDYLVEGVLPPKTANCPS
ncbi:alpha/beta hydrolase [Streptomyces sp. NPDC054956]